MKSARANSDHGIVYAKLKHPQGNHVQVRSHTTHGNDFAGRLAIRKPLM